MESLVQLSDEEFDQIEEAMARTAKGRAFLRRFRRRAMGAATEEVRSMLQEFRSSWTEHDRVRGAVQHIDVLRRELMEMAASIETARREVAALRPPDGQSDKIVTATSELDAIVISTERASFEILNAAEKLLELSGRLRASGADPQACSEIDDEVNNIFTACSFQDLTGQRTSKVVNALRYIEQRLNAMMNIWGSEGLKGIEIASENTDKRPDSHLLNGPQLEGLGVSQADVDSMFDSPAASAPSSPPPPAAPAEKQSQADIDSMFDSPPPKPAPPPAAPQKQSQADIDSMFDSPPPKPAPPPAAPAKQSQADIDSLFDSPPSKPAKPATPAKPAKPAKEEGPPPPLDQSAIDALFG